MKVRVGDKVKILAGKDKGKEGKVTLTLRGKDRVVVEGVNIVKKHQKPGRGQETGGILETENPIHVSNVKVIDSVKKDTKKTEKKAEKKAEVKTEAKKETTKPKAEKKSADKKETKPKKSAVKKDE